MLPAMAPDRRGDDPTVVVVGDAGFGIALVAALERRTGVPAIGVPVADELDRAKAAIGAVAAAAVVHVCGDDTTFATAPLISTDAATWEAGCERVMWRALLTLQAAHASFSRRGGGRIVLITTTAGVSGAPHSVPLVAAIEGIRALAKSAARQWGEIGISVNCVAVPLGLLAPSHASHTDFLPPAAISQDDPVDDVAGAVEFLAGPGAHGISGATLLVDGGAVMAP
jgi:3-oxoacyl-[acyl-carrier protein] reductase